MSRYIDAEFEENHYASILLSPTPDVTQSDKKKARIILEALRMAKSIDIEPKRGKWKRKIVDSGFNADWVCSECGYRVMTDYVSFNFCPNCGCQMKGADDE